MKKLGKFSRLLKAFSNTTIVASGALVVLFLIFAPPALALETGIEFGTQTGLGTQDIRITIMNIVRIVLGLVGLIALIFILYGGFVWMTSAGNPEKVDTAKKILRNAIIGLAIILLSFSIASFIISVLQGATGGPGGPGGPGDGDCENCDHLGRGIIESVYPVPGAQNVPRDTKIAVTFKVPIIPSSIIKGAPDNPEDCSDTPTNECSGDLESDSVSIYQRDQGIGQKLGDSAVRVVTTDGLHYTFRPKQLLGDGVRDIVYRVTLSNDIEKVGGDTAFPGAAGSFSWSFEVGTFLDLNPPAMTSVFPRPDGEPDSYEQSPAENARGSVQVSSLPRVQQSARVYEEVTNGTIPEIDVIGTYNCAENYLVCVNSTDGNSFNVNLKDQGGNCNSPTIPQTGTGFSNSTMSNGTVNIGCGLQLTFDTSENDFSGGGTKLWSFKVDALQSSDTLRIDNRTFRFVSTASAEDEIEPGATTVATASNIVTKINSLPNFSVDAEQAQNELGQNTNLIFLDSVLAGNNGNNIPIVASGDWAQVQPMSGGSNADLEPSQNGAPDQPRNAIITIDFNKTLDRSLLPVELNVDEDGNLVGDERRILVEYFNTTNSAWQAVSGKFLYSNQNQTVDFIPNGECRDADGNLVINACGEKMYCLPVNSSSEVDYVPTQYRVSLRAGTLRSCDSNDECLDSYFNTCTNNICTSGNGERYPKAIENPNGVVDMSDNSMNGNLNTFVLSGRTLGWSEGPFEQSGQVAYNLTDPQANTGDDFVWTFYVNKNIDLSPPLIEEIGPNIRDVGVSLTSPAEATFDELLMSSTLKPGSNYEDGLCSCADNSDCSEGESCIEDRCVSDDEGDQEYCSEDQQCGSNVCVNKKYISLIDTSATPVGWWITKRGFDVPTEDNPADGYFDKNMAQLQHTSFAEVTNYGAEMGSGIKDIYQNCYLPSEGPNASGGACGTDRSKPYCCNGEAMTFEQWSAAGAECYTGL